MDRFYNSEWIFVNGVGGEVTDRYFDYKTVLNAPDGKGTIYISANSQYAVYVNGIFVNCGQYDDYEHYQVFDTVELSDYLEKGDNELLICQYVCGKNTSTRSVQIPGIIFSVWNGEEELLSSNTEILSGENHRYLPNGELITGQLGFNFSYDANGEETVFSKSVSAGKQKNLFPRPVRKLIISDLYEGKICAQGVFLENDATLRKSQRMQTAFLSARRREDMCEGDSFSWNTDERCDGVYLIADLGGETNGLLTFSVDVPQETEILIGYGEHLDDLRVRSYVGSRNFCFRYVAKAGHNEFMHPFQRLGLRYLQLHIYSKSGTVNFVGVHKTDYPINYLPIPVKDGLHKRIWEVGRKTLHMCMHEHYEDCPWREQSQYAMDSRVQILCGYYAFGEYEFPRSVLYLMHHALREDGLIELCAPGKVPVNIPSFTAVYVREVLEYTEFSGDLSLAEEIFDTLRTIVDGFIARIDDSGLIPLFCGKSAWNFYEWQPGLSGNGRHETAVYESPLCAFVSDALRCFSKICEKICPDSADYYLKQSRQLADNAHKAFYDEKTGGYITRLGDEKPLHQLTQAMMLFSDAVPQENILSVENMLKSSELIECSVSMTIYAYEALLRISDDNREYVLSEIERIWGRMLSLGADTFWETEKGADDFDYAGSLCHGWSAVPIYIFSHYNLKK
ncbi:MAG: hypothetical protein IJB86_05110 [Clostridia bacterium]|nr:hypothetical protein [Clostridia bacterium]